jgi:hypothetical protein
MKRQIVKLFLLLVILLAFTGSAYSDRGWGIVVDEFGPIVVSAPAHPWGENMNRSVHNPPCYRSGSGGSSGGLYHVPLSTDFVMRFFLDYVVNKEIRGFSSPWNSNGSE